MMRTPAGKASAPIWVQVIGDMTQRRPALGRYKNSQGGVRTGLYSLPRQASGLVRSKLLGLESRSACDAARVATATPEVRRAPNKNASWPSTLACSTDADQPVLFAMVAC